MATGCSDKSPQERAELVGSDTELLEINKIFANEGQSEIDHNTRNHFVTYVNFDNKIWELDGRREAPVIKDESSADEFGKKTAKIIKQYVDMDNTCKFSIMAVAPKM